MAFDSPSSLSSQRSLFQTLLYHLHTGWLFTASDHITFVLPQTLFGIIGALSGPALTTNTAPRVDAVFARLHYVLAWTWLNTFVFALSNQSNAQAIKEDTINKPWRPLPAARISLRQSRNLLLVSVPVVLSTCYFWLGAFEETAVLLCLSWMYNEMGGADETFLIRNLLIAVGFAFYGSGALRIAAAFPPHLPSPIAPLWLACDRHHHSHDHVYSRPQRPGRGSRSWSLHCTPSLRRQIHTLRDSHLNLRVVRSLSFLLESQPRRMARLHCVRVCHCWPRALVAQSQC